MSAHLDQGGAIRKVQPCVDMAWKNAFLFLTCFLNIRSVTLVRVLHNRIAGVMIVGHSRH